MKYLETMEDLEWLQDTHLKGRVFAHIYSVAILHGNEDCPYRIDLFLKKPDSPKLPDLLFLFDAENSTYVKYKPWD